MMNSRMKALFDFLPQTPYSVSKELGFEKHYVGYVISGRNKNPSEKLFDYLVVRYNVNLEWLLNGNGEMFREGGMTNRTRQAKFLCDFMKLEPHNQEFAEKLLKALLVSEEIEKKNRNILIADQASLPSEDETGSQ